MYSTLEERYNLERKTLLSGDLYLSFLQEISSLSEGAQQLDNWPKEIKEMQIFTEEMFLIRSKKLIDYCYCFEGWWTMAISFMHRSNALINNCVIKC